MRNLELAIKYLDAKRLQGLSSDTKPTDVPDNCIFEETDTQSYYWFDGTTWARATITTATGGTITEVGDYRIHTFTATGSSTLSFTKVAPLLSRLNGAFVS